MQPIRTIESLVTGGRGLAYVSLAQAINGIDHQPESGLKDTFKLLRMNSCFLSKQAELNRPGGPVTECHMTEDERDAILLYTFDVRPSASASASSGTPSFEQAINKALCFRSDVLRDLRWVFLHMLSALRKLPPLPTETVVYHAVPSNYVLPSTYTPGQRVVWSCFVSVSPNKDLFSKNADQRTVVFEISGPGVIAHNITPFAASSSGASEFLLEPDTAFTVTNVEECHIPFNGAKLVRLYAGEQHQPILTLAIDSFRRGAQNSLLSSSRGPVHANGQKMRFENENTTGKDLCMFFKTMPENTYTPIYNALVEANFNDKKSSAEAEQDAKQLLEHCRETLTLLKKKRTLEKYNMTEEQAAAIIIFTFDFGQDQSKHNPCYRVNKALGTRDTNSIFSVRYYILHLLSALRKLPRVDPKSKRLYRGINGNTIRGDLRAHYPVGAERSWTAFTSTCYDENCAVDFTLGDAPILFEITGEFVGYDITEFSIFGDPEVIIEPDTRFVVQNVTKDSNGIGRIVVNVVPTEPPILDKVINFERCARRSKEASNPLLPPNPKARKASSQQQDQPAPALPQFTAQQQQQFQQEINAFIMSHFARVVGPAFNLQSWPAGCNTLKDVIDSVVRGNTPVERPTAALTVLTRCFFDAYPRYKAELYNKFALAGQQVLEWECGNFERAYLSFVDAVRSKVPSDPLSASASAISTKTTVIEFCVDVGNYIATMDAAVKWAYTVRQQISLRCPTGTFVQTDDVRRSVLMYNSSMVWFFMRTNTCDPDGLVKRLRATPDIISCCYITPRLCTPVYVTISCRSQDFDDPRSPLCGRRGCSKAELSAVLTSFLGSYRVAPLSVSAAPLNLFAGGATFLVCLASPDDISILSKARLCISECPVATVHQETATSVVFNALRASAQVPLYVALNDDKTHTVVFISEDSCSAFRGKLGSPCSCTPCTQQQQQQQPYSTQSMYTPHQAIPPAGAQVRCQLYSTGNPYQYNQQQVYTPQGTQPYQQQQQYPQSIPQSNRTSSSQSNQYALSQPYQQQVYTPQGTQTYQQQQQQQYPQSIPQSNRTSSSPPPPSYQQVQNGYQQVTPLYPPTQNYLQQQQQYQGGYGPR